MHWYKKKGNTHTKDSKERKIIHKEETKKSTIFIHEDEDWRKNSISILLENSSNPYIHFPSGGSPPVFPYQVCGKVLEGKGEECIFRLILSSPCLFFTYI